MRLALLVVAVVLCTLTNAAAYQFKDELTGYYYAVLLLTTAVSGVAGYGIGGELAGDDECE